MLDQAQHLDFNINVQSLDPVLYKKFQFTSLYCPTGQNTINRNFKRKKKKMWSQQLHSLMNQGIRIRLPQINNSIPHNKSNDPSLFQQNLRKTYIKQTKSTHCSESSSLKSAKFQSSNYAKLNEKLQSLQATKNNLNKQESLPYVRFIKQLIVKKKHQRENQWIVFFKQDLDILFQQIFSTEKFAQISQKAESFNKKSLLFQFRTTLLKIIFHAILAQIYLKQNKIQEGIRQFQCCQYNSMKKSLDLSTSKGCYNSMSLIYHSLSVCFLQQVAQLQVSLLDYQSAINSLKSALQLSLKLGDPSITEKILQKLSRIYYYRGNIFMGQFYLQKAENQTDQLFAAYKQNQCSYKYNFNQELEDLRCVLFGSNQKTNARQSKQSYVQDQNQQKAVLEATDNKQNLILTENHKKLYKCKYLFDNQRVLASINLKSNQPNLDMKNCNSIRKRQRIIQNRNNEIQISRGLEQQMPNKLRKFNSCINSMMKNYKTCQSGSDLRKLVQINNKIGNIIQEKKGKSIKRVGITQYQNGTYPHHQQTLSSASLNKNQKISLSSLKANNLKKQKTSSYDNYSRVIKSHLSHHRRVCPIRPQIRWKSILSFLQGLKQLNENTIAQ